MMVIRYGDGTCLCATHIRASGLKEPETGWIDGICEFCTPAQRTYTVVLLYPDYATGDFGADIYVDTVRAHSPARAVEDAQAHAARSLAEFSGHAPGDPSDFRMILLLDGAPEILGDATGIYAAREEPRP